MCISQGPRESLQAARTGMNEWKLGRDALPDAGVGVRSRSTLSQLKACIRERDACLRHTSTGCGSLDILGTRHPGGELTDHTGTLPSGLHLGLARL